MMKDRLIWHRVDWLTAALAAVVSFAVYAWTAAPNVTLLDSGEFLVAAQHFGVPHPTGYPLWTLLNWLFLLLPLGNAAWEVAIFSGICGALANGLCAALLCNIQRWCFGEALEGRRRLLPPVIALAFALMLAFSQSMWSQAVIAEVYTLHALLCAIFLIFCYAWVRNPARDGLMLWAFFALALTFSNHQLIMVMAPLPYLLILLLRRRMFLDWLFAGLLTLLLGYLAFAILSKEQAVLKTAIRWFYCVVLAFGLFLWFRKFRIRWRLIAAMPFAVAAGLLPYAYMPLASETNPPMNWAYTRDPDGFFYSINRSQYSGSLTDVTVKSLGRAMGVAGPPEMPSPARPPEETNRLKNAQLWVGFFWQQLIKAFSPVVIFGYFASAFFVFRLPLSRRAWIYFLHAAFIFAAFLQPLTANTQIDQGGWWTQMPYHTYTNLIFAILSGLGTGLIIYHLSLRRPAFFWLAPALLVLPIFAFRANEASSSQRDHWFGWQYGHDMLKDLPPGAVVFGGTDPGRFVPTYMIFGESPQPARHKRDPDFDRRDLYIITQNGLGEPFYTRYILDHYGKDRPKAKSAFELWLGRDTAYPATPLVVPDIEQTEKILKETAEKEGEGDPALLQAEIAKWIWEKNKAGHAFFVEESFPMTWTYDYALPHGLVYQILPEKLEKIPPEAVKKDFAFWKDYIARLKADPRFEDDLDAQRSFSKLRCTTGNIYRHRKMNAEAIDAYRQALEIWPGNVECLASLVPLLWEEQQFKKALAALERALQTDPNNRGLWRLIAYAQTREKLEGEIRSLTAEQARDPKNRDAIQKLIVLHSSVGDTNKAGMLVEQTVRDFPDDVVLLRKAVNYYELNNERKKMVDPALRLTQIEATNPENYFVLARAWFSLNKKKEFYEAAEKAVKLGGETMRATLDQDPLLAPWRSEEEFKKLTEPPSGAPATLKP